MVQRYNHSKGNSHEEENVEHRALEKLYKTAAWKKCRVLALQRDKYLCQRCLKKKSFVPADVVHHIQHLKHYPTKAFELENLESLCHSCHNKEHDEKGRRPEKGKDRNVRVVKI